jgi:hypothetical protein
MQIALFPSLFPIIVGGIAKRFRYNTTLDFRSVTKNDIEQLVRLLEEKKGAELYGKNVENFNF